MRFAVTEIAPEILGDVASLLIDAGLTIERSLDGSRQGGFEGPIVALLISGEALPGRANSAPVNTLARC